MIKKYTDKPREYEAIQYNGKNGSEIEKWSNNTIIENEMLDQNPIGQYLEVFDGEQYQIAIPNDYIMIYPDKSFYVWKETDFHNLFIEI